MVLILVFLKFSFPGHFSRVPQTLFISLLLVTGHCAFFLMYVGDFGSFRCRVGVSGEALFFSEGKVC